MINDLSEPYLALRTCLYLSCIFPVYLHLYNFNYVSLHLGHLFSYRQKYQLMTFLVAMGIMVCLKNLKGQLRSSLQFNHKRMFTTWLLMATCLSVFLTLDTSFMSVFKTLMPCQLNDGSRSYLFGLHYCGCVLASLAISQMLWCLQYMLVRLNFKRRY